MCRRQAVYEEVGEVVDLEDDLERGKEEERDRCRLWWWRREGGDGDVRVVDNVRVGGGL